MRLEIRGRGFEITTALREHLTRRLGFALGRFGDRVTRVTARMADANGPRGGVDKQVRLSVGVRANARVVIEDADTDLYAAIDRGAERAGRAVARVLERGRAFRGSGAARVGA